LGFVPPLTFPGAHRNAEGSRRGDAAAHPGAAAEAELTVSELTEILRQSQPRLSRHLRLLAEAGLVERFREGSWAFFRLGEHGAEADWSRG
jgi:DNA-binding transcriptional ArsR family regulator